MRVQQNTIDTFNPKQAAPFKSIDIRPQLSAFKTKRIDAGLESPETIRKLYSTGFVFKNSNSPIACNYKISSDFKIKPITPKLTKNYPLIRHIPQNSNERYDKESVKQKDMTFKTDWVGDVGWGVLAKNPFAVNERNVLKDQRHKWAYNHGELKCNFQMETTGLHSEKVDTWLGLPHHEMDAMSVRQQRKLVIKRVEQILQERAKLFLDRTVPLTRPIDTSQNMKLYIKQQQVRHATIQSEKKDKQVLFSTTETTQTQTIEPSEIEERNPDNSYLPQQIDLPKTHYLKQGCRKLLRFVNKRKDEELRSNLATNNIFRQSVNTRQSISSRRDRMPKNRLSQTHYGQGNRFFLDDDESRMLTATIPQQSDESFEHYTPEKQFKQRQSPSRQHRGQNLQFGQTPDDQFAENIFANQKVLCVSK